jgi:pre-mRNA-processing factor SLU7
MGRVIKGQETKVKSRYEEDVLINNHTAVWGSWWKDGTWGFACCHQCVKNSYCTGAAGATAIAESQALTAANMVAHAARSAEEEEKRRMESKLNDCKGYVPGVWGTETEKPEDIDPLKVTNCNSFCGCECHVCTAFVTFC